ncbi:copia protein [Tanacetum coccineum]
MDSQESQGWEYLLDIDDSDLQLSAPLSLSNISNTSFSQTQEMDNVEEKTTRIRIPGPAGIFQTDRIQKLRNFKDDPTQEYIRKRNFDDVSEDDDFQSSPWVKALEFMNDREEIGGGCFGDIESYLKKGKLEIVVAIITSCKPNVLGDMNVTLKDPSGTTSGTIHYKVLSSEDGYAKDIKVGSALILRNVSVFCDKSKNYALNITIKNLVKIIKKTQLWKMPMVQVVVKFKILEIIIVVLGLCFVVRQ